MQITLDFSDAQIAAIAAAAGYVKSGSGSGTGTTPPVTPPVTIPPVTSGPPSTIDGLKVKKFTVSVDPQETDIGLAEHLVIACKIVLPEVLNPSYSGLMRGKMGNAVSILEYAGGQYSQRMSAIVTDFSQPINWTKNANTLNVPQNAWVLFKYQRDIDKPGNASHSSVKCYAY